MYSDKKKNYKVLRNTWLCQFQIKLIQMITLKKKNRCQKTAQLVHSFKGEMLSFSSLLWFVWLELCWQRQHWEGKTNTKLWHHEGLISRAVPWHKLYKKWSKVTCIPPPQRRLQTHNTLAKWILQLWRLDVWRLHRQTDRLAVQKLLLMLFGGKEKTFLDGNTLQSHSPLSTTSPLFSHVVLKPCDQATSLSFDH